MYLHDIMQKSAQLKGLTRVCMASGDRFEGKFRTPNMDGLMEFDLQKGGTIYLSINSIESITLLDNLQMLEQLESKADKNG